MVRQKIELCVLGTVAIMLAGCAGSGVTTRSYIEDKDRVDQKMDESGYNYGYIQGTPKPEDRSNFKKTRKIFVWEFTKEPEQLPEESMEPAPRTRTRTEPQEAVTAPEPRRYEPPEWTKPVEIPALEEETPVSPKAVPAPSAPEGSFTNYEVQKGDTLQKISKKFYNTYRKWQPIYEANTDVLSDPNQLKPGMMLRIPSDGSAPAGENLK